ncbi:MAG: peptidoglycan-associated lipoprotein Pal [Pseudomonadota bacterium]|nr:peptidoglycan-associated lipoprotein Pal [Pseudomonadota bacterium]MEC7990757.1 peptidoglycan-associated lipoprotein Pal [Pseudomonadota bacterium]MEC8059193.1 peptidoglycan-associated lipoprotein Pal [Pseudomonadota bacterium]MED5581294.1 peptidoglycan-associated lipoprotein Pal [Pseudomonadota bacterium]
MLSNNRISGLFGLFLAALVISGCSSTATAPVEQQEPVAEPPVAAAPVEEVQEPEDFADDGVTPLDANGRPLSRNFYFGYDEAILNPADLAALEMHAQILRRNADKRVVIEGHCDERGTREYNLALGERRANVVASFLISAGVRSRQIESVSFGEERPADPGHTESAWALNRRAVLSYR